MIVYVILHDSLMIFLDDLGMNFGDFWMIFGVI